VLLTRLVTLLCGISAPALRALPPVDRLRLINECRRILLVLDPPVLPPRITSDVMPRRPRSGVLAALEDGERAP
jgi:hypothetical protein